MNGVTVISTSIDERTRAMTTDVHEQVRERYAEAAVGLSAGCGCGCDCESIGCCGEEATTLFGQGLYAADERAGLPENAVTASLGCGNPLAAGRAQRGRDRARPRLGRRDRRPPLREARRADGHRVRARHDRRDARARARERREGGRDERPLPQGPHRGDPARRRERRRRDLELRRQPVAREGQGARRDRARAAAGRADRDLRRGRRGSAVSC